MELAVASGIAPRFHVAIILCGPCDAGAVPGRNSAKRWYFIRSVAYGRAKPVSVSDTRSTVAEVATATKPLRPLRASPRQERELARIAAHGGEALREVTKALQRLQVAPLSIAELGDELRRLVNDDTLVEAIVSQVISLSFLCRKREESPRAVVDALTSGLRASSWDSDTQKKWDEIKEDFVSLLSIPALSLVVKTTELSVDYENFLDTAKIIVDIRPIFNEERNHVQAGILSILLKINYSNDEGNHSLTSLMNEKDLLAVRKACDQAIMKVECLQASMAKWGLRKITREDD